MEEEIIDLEGLVDIMLDESNRLLEDTEELLSELNKLLK